MILASGAPTRLGTSTPTVRIGAELPSDGGPSGRRVLHLDDTPAFELSFACGTCQLLFERLEGATSTLSLDQVRDRLGGSIATLPVDVISTFGLLLEDGDYQPMLLQVTPELVQPASSRDYFAHEQVGTWGLESFWGLPVSPRTPYYRTFETVVDRAAHLYEFVVPMVPPTWNDQSQVGSYVAELTAGAVPTAVALSLLDVCAPATDSLATDYYTHWALTHFLLDGHHKLEAAARTGRPVRLLSLLSWRDGLSTPAELERVVELRSRSARARRPRVPGQ